MIETVTIATRGCLFCGKEGTVTVDKDGYDRWQAGALIQVAFPYLSAGKREQLLTGTHGECFDRWVDEG